jgi:E3 ubiquitin-protein ligase DOA10
MNEAEKICRICLFASNEEQNPMISICKCKGTMNLLHIECLKMWLKQKLSEKMISNKPGVSYTIKSFNCEICKEPYPSMFNLLLTNYSSNNKIWRDIPSSA